jgi:ArsR family transcriptional regulator
MLDHPTTSWIHARILDTHSYTNILTLVNIEPKMALRGKCAMRQIIGLTRREILDSRCCAPPALPVEAARAADEARLFRALGDATRVQIVGLLAEQAEPLCVCHVEAAFDLSQPTISHHLKVLRDAGLVTTERRGVWIYYGLRRERFRALRDVADAIDRKVEEGRKADVSAP